MQIQVETIDGNIYKFNLLSFVKTIIAGIAIKVLFKNVPTPSIVAWGLVWFAYALVRVIFKQVFMNNVFVYVGLISQKSLRKAFIPFACAQLLSLGIISYIFVLNSVHPSTFLEFLGWACLSIILMENQITKTTNKIL